MILAAALAGAPHPPSLPPGLLFAFYRMVAFRQRAHELNCGSGDLDDQLAGLRRQLIDRYGKKPFSPPEQPASQLPGQCDVALNVYRVNLADFRKAVATDLAAPAPTTHDGAKE